MNPLVVGMADCRVSNHPESVLVTYALGSCIAVTIHDHVAGVGGLLHFMLPESALDRAKARANPYMFGDTGIPLLFQAAYKLGGEKRRLTVTAAGGAQMMDQQGVFNIGRRNYLAMRKIFRKAGVLLWAEDVGGLASRRLRLEVGSGRVWLCGPGEPERDLLAAGECRERAG
jgi:chemotaxis protein CheD